MWTFASVLFWQMIPFTIRLIRDRKNTSNKILLNNQIIFNLQKFKNEKDKQTIVVRDCRLMFSIWPKQPTVPIHFCVRITKFTFLYLIPVVSAGFFVHCLWQRRSSPLKAFFYVYIFVSGGRQMYSLLCSILSASCTTFAVCMPKKIYRISVNFVRALTRLR